MKMPDHMIYINSAVPIASCTKIMTCIICLNYLNSNLLHYNDKITISKYVSQVNNSSANLKYNEV